MALSTVNSMLELRAFNPTQIPESIHLLGYYAPGDGGGGLFRFQQGTLDTDNGGTVIEPDSGWQHDDGRWLRHFEHEVSVRWFGAHAEHNQPGGTPSTGGPMISNIDAFTRAIRSLTPMILPDYRGPLVLVPPGLYDFDDTLVIDRSVTLMGAGNGLGPSATTLRFPVDTVGIDVFQNLPPPRPPPSPPLSQRPRGSNTVLEGFMVTGRVTGSGPDAHGINIRCGRIGLRNVSVRGFGGNGVHLVAAVPATGGNLWRMENVSVSACRHGFFFDGPDSNAGVGIGLDATSNRAWGFYDSSFLGNSYIGCHAASNVAGSYKVDSANARCIFVGCYTEGDQPPPEVDGPSMIIGGLFKQNSGSGGQISQTNNGITVVKGALRVTNTNPISNQPTIEVTSMLGGRGRSALEFASANDSRPFRLEYDNSIDGSKSGWWELNWAQAGNGTPFAFSMKASAEWTEKKGGAKAWMPGGFYLGKANANRDPGNDGRVYVGSGTSAPTTGVWSRGDRILNNSPIPNHPKLKYLGWLCIEGTDASVQNPGPGSWIPYGEL